MRGAAESCGVFLGNDIEDLLLVVGRQEAVEAADCNGLHIGTGHLPHRLAHRFDIQRRLDAPIGAHTLGDFEAHVAADQRLRLVGIHVVEAGALLAADFQQVAKAIGDQQAGLHAAQLDERIGGDGSTVPEEGDGIRRGVDGREALSDAGGNAARRIIRGGRYLPDIELPGFVVEQADVGERAAGIDANSPHHCY